MTVQGPVKEQQPDGMSHRGGGSPTEAQLIPIPPKPFFKNRCTAQDKCMAYQLTTNVWHTAGEVELSQTTPPLPRLFLTSEHRRLPFSPLPRRAPPFPAHPSNARPGLNWDSFVGMGFYGAPPRSQTPPPRAYPRRRAQVLPRVWVPARPPHSVPTTRSMRRLTEKRQDAPPKFSATGGRDLKACSSVSPVRQFEGSTATLMCNNIGCPPPPPPKWSGTLSVGKSSLEYHLVRGLWGRTVRCALFSTTGSHGAQGPKLCTLQPLLVHQGFFF